MTPVFANYEFDPLSITHDIGGKLTSSGVVTIDLRRSGRGLPLIIGIVLGITNSGRVSIRHSLELPATTPLFDIVGKELTNIMSSGMYLVNSEPLRFLVLDMTIPGMSSVSYYLVH